MIPQYGDFRYTEVMSESESKRRWYRPMPGRLIAALLAWEGILLVIEQFQWIPKGWTVLIAIASVGLTLLLLFFWFLFAFFFRRRFQYSIRSLLLLSVAVAVPCSWLSVEVKKAREQEEITERIVKLGGGWMGDYPRHDSHLEQLMGLTDPLGFHFFMDIVEVQLDDFSNCDYSLVYTKNLSKIKQLSIKNSHLTDEGLEEIKDLKNLEVLSLDYAQITDAGLEHIKGLSNLEELSLVHTPITDEGLEKIACLKKLHLIYLNGTLVTEEGMEKFQKCFATMQNKTLIVIIALNIP